KAALNALGPAHALEAPGAPDPAFEASVQAWVERTGVDAAHATILMALRERARPTSAIARIVDGTRTGKLVVGEGAEERWIAELALRLYGSRGPAIVTA